MRYRMFKESRSMSTRPEMRKRSRSNRRVNGRIRNRINNWRLAHGKPMLG